MSDSSSEAFEHKMESLETSLHEDVSEEEKDDMLTRVLYGVVDTNTVTGSRVEIHQNDKSTKVQQDSRRWYSRERHVYFLCSYFCCQGTKVQKYKKYKKNPGRMGP